MKLIKTDVEKHAEDCFMPFRLDTLFMTHGYDLWGTNFAVEFEYVPNQN